MSLFSPQLLLRQIKSLMQCADCLFTRVDKNPVVLSVPPRGISNFG